MPRSRAKQLLTIAMSMPMSMTFEEIELARLRFDGVVRFEFTDEIDSPALQRLGRSQWEEHGRSLRYAFDGRKAMLLALSLFAVFMVLARDPVLSEVHHLRRVNRAWCARHALATIIISTMLASHRSTRSPHDILGGPIIT